MVPHTPQQKIIEVIRMPFTLSVNIERTVDAAANAAAKIANTKKPLTVCISVLAS